MKTKKPGYINCLTFKIMTPLRDVGSNPTVSANENTVDI